MTSNTTASTAEKAATQEAEDFFARAKAMGLNLTRQDYERARAGVSAFLKAQRVASPNPGESSGSAGAGSNTVTVGSELQSSIAESMPGSAKMPSQSRLTGRSTSSPMLSFFTAIVPTEENDGKARPSLDDVGALEEKKRRRERRRRMREKKERGGDDSTPTHLKDLSITSTLLDGSPLTAPSIGNRSSAPPSSRLEMLSNQTWQGRVGLGLQIEDGQGELDSQPAHRAEEAEIDVVPQLQSPAELTKQLSMACQSPGLRKLSQKAHIDGDGRLTLLATPNQRRSSEEALPEEDIVAMTNNTGAETDDSGVFLVSEPVKKEWSRPRRPSSTDTSPLVDLHESLDRLSFLDRIMAQKRSPIRLKREAKAREKEARRNRDTRQGDLVVMTATTTTTAPPPAQSALQPLAPHHHQAKNVRWAHDSSSPRQRMTTKEHYDFAFYGIAPNPADLTSNLPAFYEEEVKRNAGETGGVLEQAFHVRQRTTSNWMRPHLGQSNMGSPIATRGPATTSQDSPGVLSLGLESVADRLDSSSSMSAKRGLLFGPSSNDDGRTSPNFTESELFSHGPTLARSPARNVFDSFTMSTPSSMTRSVTALAAPFSFHQQLGVEGRGAAEDSPDRVMLMRAHSSGTLDRRLSGHLHQTSLLAKRVAKENTSPDVTASDKKAHAGWAPYRSPMNRSDTISPAAIFGMTSAQPRNRVLSGDIQEMGRLPLQQTTRGQSRRNVHEANSDEEGDDERELDGSSAINSSGAGRRYDRSPLQRSHFTKHHTRDSSASTSVFEGSPMYLDIHNRTASIVSTLPSSTVLASALEMPGGEGKEVTATTSTKAKKKKTKGASDDQQQRHPQLAARVPLKASTCVDTRPASRQEEPSSSNPGAMSTFGRMEWDKPDGSRVIKLISEELQAALESGSLTAEPPARYYKLPPEWGQTKSKPLSVSYAGMIGQALLSSSDGRLSLNEIYNWISTVYPFFERGDRGWQNSIRHNLSLNKSFIKVEREAHIPGKGGWWAIKQGHEDRFRGGSYIAPGSTLSQKVGPKTPKTSTYEDQSHWVPSQQEEMDESDAQLLRRKRQESDGRSETQHASDSDYHPSIQAVKPSKKSKKVKLVGGTAKKIQSSTATSPAIDGKQSSLAPIQKKVPLRPVQSSSPQDASFDSLTPHRTHQFIASSGHGSTSTTSMMAGMPMLTDASSPPSSPNNTFDGLMPPPSGGVQGAASSQSARKRKQAVSRAVDKMNTGLMQHQQTGFTPQTASLSTNGNGYNHLSAHTLQASPLAHMRGSNGSNGNASALVGNARLRAGPGHSLINAMDSPLRRHSGTSHGSPIDNSPSRLFVNSPISSMRGQQDSMERSTTGADHDGEGKENLMPSPSRGSPMRGGSQFGTLHHHQQQHNFQSPAGMHLQMAVGPGGASAPGSQYLGFGGGGNTPTRYTDQNNGNFLYQRWGLSPSPGKSLRFNAGTPTMYSHNGASHGNGSGPNGLDDPFDYSGTLQHELEMTTGLGHFDGTPSESPMKMAYPQVVRNTFFNGQTQQQPLQPLQPQQQQQQQQQQLHYLSNSSYATSLAASHVFGGTAVYRDANEH